MRFWRHLICGNCWDFFGTNRPPQRVDDAREDVCCFCGQRTSSGIFVRQDPDKTECRKSPVSSTVHRGS